MNIVFGGSFNPITKGHQLIAEHLIKKYSPKKLVFLPVGNDYGKPELIDSKHRINMIKLICNDVITVSDYECVNEYKGTYETLQNLGYEDAYFVIGYDNLKSLKSWNNYDKLLSEYHLIVVNRPNCELKLDAFKGYEDRVLIVDDIDLDVSSSQFRETKDWSIIDERVAEYIKANKLYE